MRFLLALMCLVLGGCSAAQWNDKLSTPADRDLALKMITALRSGDLGPVQAAIAPDLLAQTVTMQAKTKALMPKTGTPALVTVNASTFTTPAGSTTREVLNYQLGEGTHWAFVQIVLGKADGRVQLIGWHAAPSNRAPASVGDFTLTGKAAGAYLWLAAMAASTLTILAALVLLARGKGITRRWLWAIGIIIGLGQFSLNWNSGEWRIQPVAFQFFGSAAFRASPFDAWVLSFSLPVVAVVFLIRRRALLAKAAGDFA